MKEFFALKTSPHHLRNNNLFKKKRINSVWHGTESLSYLGRKVWDLLPNEKKNLNTSVLSKKVGT